MTFTISPGHDFRYLTKQVGQGKENYYLQGTEQGEPPGIWQGRGAEALGLTGKIDAQDMEALFGHFVDPRDPAFRDPERWAEAVKLGRAPRKFASPDELLARKLEQEPDATPERVEQLRAQAQKEARQAVSFLDLTFSPAKSVTVLHTSLRAQELAAQRAGDQEAAELWGQRAHAVEQAIWAGNNAGLEFWAEHAGFSRVGYHGRKDPDGASVGRYVDGHDWVVGSFFQHTSRAGDPQLHIHNPVLNRVQNPDGQWRTLDSRAVHRVRPAAAAVAERTMFEQLQRALGVEVAWRPDGKSLELVGVPQAARDLFSSRRKAITAGVAQRVEAFRERYGREPNALELSRLSVRETLESRPGKTGEVPTLEQELDRWSAQLRDEVDLTMASVAEGSIGKVDAEQAAEVFVPARVIAQALAKLQEKKAAWTRYDLIKAINDELPGCLGGLEPGYVRRRLDELADMAVAPAPAVEEAAEQAEVVRLTAPDLVPPPAEFRRKDGSSQFEAPTAAVYTTAAGLRAEERLVAAAERGGAPVVPSKRVEELLEEAAQGGRALGPDQADAVRGVLTSGRRVEVLIGLAGAGKSYTVSTLAQAWEKEVGGRVFGLAPSEIAARVLQDEGLNRSMNFELWKTLQAKIDHRAASIQEQQWQLRPGDLVVADEAGMMNRDQLEEIRRRVEAAGAKLLTAGDDRQLPSVGAGGGLRLLAQHATTYELTEVRRMAAQWEREASARLRRGDPEVVAVYERHGRLVDGGTVEQAADAAGRAWLASTLRSERALLIVGTNEQAADLSDQLRARLVDLGLVEEGGERIGRRDDNTGEVLSTVAGVGDVIQTRKIDRKLRDPDGREVLNRDLYRVVGRPGGGALEVRRISFGDDGQEQLGPVLTLPSEYLQQHATLGYAVTTHGAQGVTVPASYALTTQNSGADQLYVALSRGILTNIAFVETLKTPEHEREPRVDEDDDRRVSPAGVVASILERHVPERSALEIERDSFRHAESLTALGAQWSAAMEETNRVRFAALADQLVEEGKLDQVQRQSLDADEAAGPLWRLVRSAELAGHDPHQVLTDAIEARSLGDADSVARVLHHRLTNQLEGKLVAQVDTYTDRTPQLDTPVGQWAQQLAEAMDARTRELGEQLAENPPEWAQQRLGAVPDDPLERDDWTARAGRVAAYREHYLDQADAVDALGPCPPPGAAESRAAWYAAWRALGEPEQRRAEAELTVEQLRDRITTYAREEVWAPEWVGEELQTTSHATREHQERAALLHARARAEEDPQRRAELVYQASSHTALAQELEQVRQQLEQVDEARGRWYLHTAGTRQQAQAARAELKRRGIDPDQAAAADATTAVPAELDPADRAQQAEIDQLRHDVDQATMTAAGDAEQRQTPAAETTPATAEVEPQVAADQAEQTRRIGAAVWPAQVPAVAEVSTKVQRAGEALRTIAARQAEAEQEAELEQAQLDAEQQKQRQAEDDRKDAPTLARIAGSAFTGPTRGRSDRTPPPKPRPEPGQGRGRGRGR